MSVLKGFYLKRKLSLVVLLSLFASLSNAGDLQEKKSKPQKFKQTEKTSTEAEKNSTEAEKNRKEKAGVIIKVGSAMIRQSQVDTLVDVMARQRYGNMPLPPKDKASLQKLIANNLIGQSLMVQEIKRLGLTVDNKAIDSAYQNFKKQLGGEKALADALKQVGDTEASVREKLKQQLLTENLLLKHLKVLQRPDDKELLEIFNKNKTQFPVNDSLRASQIVITLAKDATADQVSKKKADLEKLRSEILLQKDTLPKLVMYFAQAAAQFSQTPEGKRGGDLKRFHPSDFFPEFKTNVEKLKVGELSPVFRTSLGLHLVMLTERFDGKFESYKLGIMQEILMRKTAANQEDLKKLLQSLAQRYKVVYIDSNFKEEGPLGIY